MMKAILIVGLGGALGSILRYLGGIWMLKYISSVFPVSTFVVNILGCFLAGLFYGLSVKHASFNAEWVLFSLSDFVVDSHFFGICTRKYEAVAGRSDRVISIIQLCELHPVISSSLCRYTGWQIYLNVDQLIYDQEIHC